MKQLLWLILAIATLLPAITYLVYFRRRLGTRRRQLLQTLLSLSLDNEYMLMRHGQSYDTWSKCDPQTRVKDFERLYFNEDFRAGYSHQDYAFPVLLFVTFSAIGWLLTLHLVHPGLSGLANADGFLPATFAYGFVGAYMACILTIFEGFRRYDLDPNLFYSVSFNLVFASFAAYVATLVFRDSYAPLVAVGVGLFPLRQTWSLITRRAAQSVGGVKEEKEMGEELARIQGLEDQHNRQKLLDIGISTIQGLATADPLLVFFRTTFPLRTVVDMIDKSILYLYIGERVEELRKHGINGVIELVALAKLVQQVPAYTGYSQVYQHEQVNELFAGLDTDALINDIARVLGQTERELKAFIFNMYYDPMVKFIYEIWGRYLNRPVERQMAPPQMTPPPPRRTAAELGLIPYHASSRSRR